MKLTKKQKIFIKNNLDKLSTKQIAKELNLDLPIIQKYVETIKKEKQASNLQSQIQNIKKYHLISCLILLILIFAVYFNSLKSPFMYDDYSTIIRNYHIKDFRNLRYIFTSNYFSFFGEDSYRPLCTVSYFIDYYFYKLNSIGFHITNTIFHASSVILIYFLIFIPTKNFILSLFTSLIFAVHPIQTEAVNAISFREDLMAMVFMLLSIIIFVKMISLSNFKKYIFYSISLFLFILAVFSKETALITPLILILYNFTFRYGYMKNIFYKTNPTTARNNIREILKEKYFYLGFLLLF